MRWLLLLVVLVACSDNDPLSIPQVLDPTPFRGQPDGRIATDTDLDAVAVGLPVTLRWTTPGFTAFEWTLTVPEGSLAALSDPAAAEPSFTPDVEGIYWVTGLASGGALIEEAVRRITAATYLGRASCSECHFERADQFRFTDHARTVERRGNILFGNPGCTTCHVVNPIPPPAMPVAGSFDDEAAQAGFDPMSYTDWDSFVQDFPTVANVSNVLCENCHGPGNQHDSDPRRTSVTLRATMCGTCHNGTVGPDTFGQWEGSAHGNTVPEEVLQDDSCKRCHTARSFIRSLEDLPPDHEEGGVPGVTCAACHDPHSAEFGGEVRVFGTVPLTSGSPYNGGRAAACLLCHQTDVADPVVYADTNQGIPCATQSDMIASQGAIEYGLSFGTSFHATTVFRLRTFTGDPNDSDTPDSCVICHMAPSGRDDLGEHSWWMRQGGTELAAGNCDRCHPGLTTFDRPTGDDFDGDGSQRGVQTELRGLVINLGTAIFDADVNNGLTRPGGPLAPIFIDPDPALTTPELRQAVFNYNFVVIDGSWGVHNTTYAVQLCQRTYEQVTGIPYGVAFPDADIR